MKRRLQPAVAVGPPAEVAANAEAVLQVKIWLVGISPMVWRRVLVPATLTLRLQLGDLATQLHQLLLLRLDLAVPRKGLMRIRISFPQPAPQYALRHVDVAGRLSNRHTALLDQLHRLKLELAAEFSMLHSRLPIG